MDSFFGDIAAIIRSAGESLGGDPLPADVSAIGVIAHTKHQVFSTGTHGVKYRFVADCGPDAGKFAWGTLWFNPAPDKVEASFARLMKTAVQLGVDPEAMLKRNPKVNSDPAELCRELGNDLLGKRCKVSTEASEDGLYVNVKWLNPAPKSAPEAAVKVDVAAPTAPSASGAPAVGSPVSATPAVTRPAAGRVAL